MNFDDFQEQAWGLALPSAKRGEYLIPGLAGEAGEVCSLYAKAFRDSFNATQYGKDMQKELGDVLWFVACIAKSYGINLSTVAYENLQKLYDRKQRGVLGGSGNER